MDPNVFETPMTPAQTRIADAAIRVIANQGFDVVSVRTVAQESDLSAGTIQYHYKTRQDLLIAALVRSSQRQAERSAPTGEHKTYRAGLRASLRQLLPIDATCREDVAVWVSYGAAASTRDWLAELYVMTLGEFHRTLEQVLTQAQEQGRLREGLTPTMAASLVTALVNGLALDHLNAPRPDPPAMEEALDRGLALIVTD